MRARARSGNHQITAELEDQLDEARILPRPRETLEALIRGQSILLFAVQAEIHAAHVHGKIRHMAIADGGIIQPAHARHIQRAIGGRVPPLQLGMLIKAIVAAARHQKEGDARSFAHAQDFALVFHFAVRVRHNRGQGPKTNALFFFFLRAQAGIIRRHAFGHIVVGAKPVEHNDIAVRVGSGFERARERYFQIQGRL